MTCDGCDNSELLFLLFCIWNNGTLVLMGYLHCIPTLAPIFLGVLPNFGNITCNAGLIANFASEVGCNAPQAVAYLQIGTVFGSWLSHIFTK